jgi:hypothetical protein
VGFVVDKVALGQVASEYFGLPCQLSFHQLRHTHQSYGAGTKDPVVAFVYHARKKATVEGLYREYARKIRVK